MDRLARQIQEAQKLLQEPDADWKACSDAMEELAVAVEVMGEADSKKEAVKLLTGISREIGLQINSIRSRQAKDACESLLRVVVATGQDFLELANALLPQIVSTAKNSSAAVRQPGSRLLSKISELVRYDLALMRRIFVQQTQDRVRVLLLDQLMIVLVYWLDEEVLARESDVLKMIQRGLDDQSAKVRKAAREALTRYSTRWSERVDEWVDMPSSQAKALLISDHRDSPLAQAILKKYPEVAKKSDPLSQSRTSFSHSRTGLRRSFRQKREQNIEIHVSATPPPTQREQEKAVSQRSNGGEVAINANGEKGAVSRRLFDDANLSDDDELENVVAAFDGSQMYGFTAKEEAGESFASAVGAIPSPTVAAIPSRVAVARSSSASSVEGASLRHPGIRKLQESKIPTSPLNRSPSLLNKKYLDSPTGYSSSPELRPSRLPRPGSFTLKSRGSSGTSTPVAAENSGDEKSDMNPLSASDEYFSKPIPSSITTPTPPPPSTDNVTMRPKRRAFIQDEQEKSPLQSYSPALQKPAQKERTRSQQDQIAPDVVFSDPFETDAASLSPEEQFAEYKFDEADDIGRLTEGSVHDDSENEWSDRRQDDGQAGVERGHGFVQEGDGQPSPSGDDIFPDDWRLDEGPRHKFDDHVSDDQADVVDEAEDEHISITNGEEGEDMAWHERGRAPPEAHVSEQSALEDEEADEQKPAADVNSDTSPKDALEGLLGVRAEMTRLRAITRTEENSYERSLKEQYASTGNALGTADTVDEPQEKSPVKHDAQEWTKPRRTEASYFERLSHADRFSRSPQLAPPIAAPREQSKDSELPVGRSGSPSPAQSDEQELDEAATAYQGLEEFNFLGQEHAPSRVLEHAGARPDEHEPFDFVKEYHAGEDFHQHAETYSPTPPKDTQDAFVTKEFHPGDDLHEQAEAYSPDPQGAKDSFVAHEQVGRFDAAEKLFAAKEVPSTHVFYGRPPAVDPEAYMYPETYQERMPPTPLGPKLNPAFANIQKDAGYQNREDAGSKGLHAEDEAERKADAANVDATPTPSAEQPRDELPSKLSWQIPERVNTAEMSAPSSKRAAHPLEPEHVARRISQPPSETRAPPAKLGWLSSCGITLAVLFAAVFCIAGILHGARTVNESREYHAALKARIDTFEASIAESHTKVLKLEQDYAVWSDYVRKLTEEDEQHALTQLEAIQVEVHKWQQDMKADLVQFRQALSVDAIESAFAAMRVNNTPQIEN